LIDIISSLPVLLFNLCFTFTNNCRIVTYVKRIRALRTSGAETVLRIKHPVSSIEDPPRGIAAAPISWGKFRLKINT